MLPVQLLAQLVQQAHTLQLRVTNVLIAVRVNGAHMRQFNAQIVLLVHFLVLLGQQRVHLVMLVNFRLSLHAVVIRAVLDPINQRQANPDAWFVPRENIQAKLKLPLAHLVMQGASPKGTHLLRVFCVQKEPTVTVEL